MEITAGFGLQNNWSQSEYHRRRQTTAGISGSTGNRMKAAASEAAPTTRTRVLLQNVLFQGFAENELDGSSGVEKKLQRGTEFLQELEEARVNEPEKYEKMLRKIHLDQVDSIGKFMGVVEENNGEFDFRGISFGKEPDQVEVDIRRLNKKIEIGDMSSGRILSVPLSNGYTLNFNRENADDISKMLDLFTSEDINAILNAIQGDNLARNAEQEIEDEKSNVVKLAQNTESSPDLSKLLADREGTLEETEESETKSHIVLKPDGTKVLIVTTSVGDMELQTSFKISEGKDETKGDWVTDGKETTEALEYLEKMRQTPTLFRWNQALNSYEENFSYA